jgi:hypothetical protein
MGNETLNVFVRGFCILELSSSNNHRPAWLNLPRIWEGSLERPGIIEDRKKYTEKKKKGRKQETKVVPHR